MEKASVKVKETNSFTVDNAFKLKKKFIHDHVYHFYFEKKKPLLFKPTLVQHQINFKKFKLIKSEIS